MRRLALFALAPLALALAACTPAPPAGDDAAENVAPAAAEDPSVRLPYDLQAVDFVSVSHGWVVGNDEGNNVSAILRTIDGGATWTVEVEIVGDTLLDVDFADERTGYAVGTAGVVYASGDGGKTWAAEPASAWPAVYARAATTTKAPAAGNVAPSINASVASIVFADAKTGWA